ncbi:Formamidopyrimidine-DNA glycosylase [Paraconexibacter sp. AEG42_29]|uniref:Formamidopyrimidine-DNA glycosylase n=1 Tax=Paraconexibacter sp. AEG42_29 TaxID=2997339 RepID=A0AAU7ATI7_9ACTN
MPELPEVEAARTLIAERAVGRTVAAVDDADTYVCRPHLPGDIASALVGRTLTAAGRIGKSMFLDTDDGDGPILGLHLGMAGRMVFVDGEDAQVTAYAGDPMSANEILAAAGAGANASTEAPAPPAGGHPDPRLSGDPAWARFTITFDDDAALILFDKRRLGRAVLNPDLSRLGPDALLVPKATFRERVGVGEAPLKARIMDQSVIAGVGNLLADETLWQARLAPLRPAGTLTTDELDDLWKVLRRCTRAAMKHGGVHTGRVIEFRKKDAACPRCGGAMVKAAVGGRTTWWCSVEQAWP